MKEIDDLKKTYELPHYWRLRKEFIQMYKDQFNLDRLICLSSVFVNVTFLGVTYSDAVMQLVQELGSSINTEYNFLQNNEKPIKKKRYY